MGGGIRPGAERLGLERFQGPGAAHLIGQDALDVVFDIHNIDYREFPAGAADVFEVSIVSVSLKPGYGLARGGLRPDSQVLYASAVKLKEDFCVGGSGNHNTFFTCRMRGSRDAPGRSGCGGVGSGIVAADQDVIDAVVIGRKAVAVLNGGRAGRGEIRIRAAKQDMVAANMTAAGIDIFVYSHSQLLFRGVSHLVKISGSVVPAKLVPAAHGIFQVGVIQSRISDAAGRVIIIQADAHF